MSKFQEQTAPILTSDSVWFVVAGTMVLVFVVWLVCAVAIHFM